MKTVLVTGAAGFIGFHTCRALLNRGDRVIGLDNLNSYYDPQLKEGRLRELGRENPGQSDGGPFSFYKGDLSEPGFLERLLKQNSVDSVVHLAAQAGVRYSLLHPADYVESNIVGFFHVLEAVKNQGVKHLVFASSSSVYGASKKYPFSVTDPVDQPVSLYAATKKSNELMAYSYSHLHGIPMTGLRFFTVYGPWGRPDMAYFSFSKAIVEGTPIQVFNQGNMKRDFTYIDDIVDGVVAALDHVPQVTSLFSLPYRIYNLGNHRPVPLMDFIAILEREIGKKAILEFKAMQPGDVVETAADIMESERDLGFHPKTSLEEGVRPFVRWFKDYYKY